MYPKYKNSINKKKKNNNNKKIQFPKLFQLKISRCHSACLSHFVFRSFHIGNLIARTVFGWGTAPLYQGALAVAREIEE